MSQFDRNGYPTNQPYSPPPAPTGYTPPPPVRPKRKTKTPAIILLTILSLIVIALCGGLVSAINDNAKQAAGSVQPALGVTPTGTPDPEQAQRELDEAKADAEQAIKEAERAAKTLTEGSWEVASKTAVLKNQMAPGTWKIKAAEDGFNCYWERVRNWDGELDSIIANGNISPGKTVRVRVKKSDAGLTLRGECEATK